jgi:hypothetical protein
MRLRSPDPRNESTVKDVRRLDFGSGFDQREQGIPMPRMRHLCSCPDARAGCERQTRRLANLSTTAGGGNGAGYGYGTVFVLEL